MAHRNALLPRPETREIRVRFATPSSLRAGLERARRESWVRSARIDWVHQELVVCLAGGARPEPRHLRVVDAERDQAAA